ncbi:UNVERIFIED_CONTAM: hypothetical protein FKN15_045471 [Acipenser sinensis]
MRKEEWEKPHCLRCPEGGSTSVQSCTTSQQPRESCTSPQQPRESRTGSQRPRKSLTSSQQPEGEPYQSLGLEGDDLLLPPPPLGEDYLTLRSRVQSPNHYSTLLPMLAFYK